MIILQQPINSMPFLATAFAFIVSKKRLIIEYLLIAVGITLAGAIVALWVQKKETDAELAQVQSKLTVLEFASNAQDKTISDLLALRQRDAEVVNGLIGDYKSLSSNDVSVRSKLQTLEKSNAKVSAYLDTPLPADLVCLLNSGCPDSDSNQSGSATAANSANRTLPSSRKP